MKTSFKQVAFLDENIIAVINPLIGGDHEGAPFTVREIIDKISQARLDKDPEKVRNVIKMLDLLITYVTTLSNGKSRSTIVGIENVKTAMLKILEKGLKEELIDGTFKGLQSGYDFISDDKTVTLKTKDGVRGINIPCEVMIKDGKLINHSLGLTQ